MKAERARPAPGLLPPGGSRHHEKDSLEEGLVDGWVRWDPEGGSSTFHSVSPHPTPSLDYELPRWGRRSASETQCPQIEAPASTSAGSFLEKQIL